MESRQTGEAVEAYRAARRLEGRFLIAEREVTTRVIALTGAAELKEYVRLTADIDAVYDRWLARFNESNASPATLRAALGELGRAGRS